ncbi:MAG: hypothetical protein ACI8RZ_001979 [Myxococcota bacterium]|jgi:hypothetical protein
MTHALLALTLLGCQAGARPADAPRSQAPDGFWEHWGDGKAEVVGYRLTQPRYGESRSGEVVMVFVTETLTHAQRVKSDGGHRDEYPVIKLNEIRDFQTGIYDYNTMTSALLPLSGTLPRGLVSRLTFSMQEWCGHIYADLIAEHDVGADPDTLRLSGRGYFDGESSEDRALEAPTGGVVAEALPVLVRGLVGDLLAPGGQVTVPYLPRLLDSRLLHERLDWTTATLQRSAQSAPLTVPAGDFTAWSISVTPDGGSETTWYIEDAAPHRLLGWQSETGESGWMTGSLRTAYWQQHREGDESLRSTLGLSD